ncbi:MAG: DUF2630 family protein [Marmoricola sp.]
MADDIDIRQHINDLIATERDLRDRLTSGEISREEEHERLRKAEVELDQCWDLLRQRDALREYGEDPDRAAVRG